MSDEASYTFDGVMSRKYDAASWGITPVIYVSTPLFRSWAAADLQAGR